jgi:hypothetical protein
MGLASVPLVVVTVGIIPAGIALILAVMGLRGDPSPQQRRRLKVAAVSAAGATALWITAVVAVSVH